MIYELWDIDTANLVGAFETEDAALAVVQQAVRAHGLGAIETLALGREDEGGDTTVIASGAALVRLAEARLGGEELATSQTGEAARKPA